MSALDHDRPSIRRIEHLTDATIAQLAGVLMDCVEGGASVGFMHPLELCKAEAFFRRLGGDVAAGARILLVAEDDTGIVGTVQVVLAQPDNQPHRGDITKMLVHRRARRRGTGFELMQAAEAHARASGKSLLVLDTVTGSDAERLYRRLGWILAGVIPDYALFPRGGLTSTSVYYRQLT
jgi:GNAT superfamily N-acetyltransferase